MTTYTATVFAAAVLFAASASPVSADVTANPAKVEGELAPVPSRSTHAPSCGTYFLKIPSADPKEAGVVFQVNRGTDGKSPFVVIAPSDKVTTTREEKTAPWASVVTGKTGDGEGGWMMELVDVTIHISDEELAKSPCLADVKHRR